MPTRRIVQALDMLNRMIENGREYPDAEHVAAKAYNVSQNELRHKYDQQFQWGADQRRDTSKEST